MSNGWRTINSLVHKIRLHGRRGKGMAESFSRQKSRHAPQKEGELKILCDLPPVWPRLVRPTNLMSRMDGKKTHTHTDMTPKQRQNNHGSSLFSFQRSDFVFTAYVTVYYYYHVWCDVLIIFFCSLFFWCPCMAVNVSVQYHGGLLPDIILLTQ